MQAEYKVYSLPEVVKTLQRLGCDDRAAKEIKLAHVYRHALDPDETPTFMHGTAGHNSYVTMAWLAHQLHHAIAQQRPTHALFEIEDQTQPLHLYAEGETVCVDLPAELFTEDCGTLVLRHGEQTLLKIRVSVAEEWEDA